MTKLSPEEYKRNRELYVWFTSYDKYTFTFESKYAKGNKLVVKMGGNADDIYRADVSVHKTYQVKDFDNHECFWAK